jgi:hypothetical protein
MSVACELPNIYQLRVVLRGVSPIIWRRLLVASNSTIADLHVTMQIAMGWADERLHAFRIHGKEYGCARVGGVGFRDDPRTVRLANFRLHPGERFLYEYNFTACWECDIRLEAILPRDPRHHYPRCTGGKRAGPPDSCDGPWAYLEQVDEHRLPFDAMLVMAEAAQLLLDEDCDDAREALGDDGLEELREAVDRVDEYHKFQPELFDRKSVNAQLRDQVRQGGGRDEGQSTGPDDPG